MIEFWCTCVYGKTENVKKKRRKYRHIVMYLETQCIRYIMYLSNPENFPLKAVVRIYCHYVVFNVPPQFVSILVKRHYPIKTFEALFDADNISE